ncbi:monovalent cation/H+ antiporter subunit A [Bosea sp. (in: a-proteobacteria)]|uniref:monovalent cation/H+ antiporter subunit A n=1 Tax=Bosea sp. (in: a-proteobacteria) TaxID=1871050 RepID=UPI0026062886|nr:monovalent cation/H+ antiporter subunit A [Bosea sp. (in: a-proteobacteria)]MCO5090241.1 monovalent cation/H+ antiporter subunit A [Bosea sp. (in: a-proteobacteria)]
MQGSTPLIWLVVLPFVTSLAAAALRSNARNAEAWLAGLMTLGLLILTILLYPAVANGAVLRLDIPWVAGLGLVLALRLDGFAWMFAMLITGIGFLVVVYTRYYMSPDDPIPRFYAFFLAFMGSMLGIVLSGNLIQLVVFWELTSIFSFLLIGYWFHNAAARDGARMALTMTGLGGLALLAGALAIGHVVGSYDLDTVLASGNRIRDHGLYRVILVLVLLGAFTKSAQFPFHFWLPNAMAAPTPVSAFLHSATMVKAGVFLMARLWPVLAGTYEWFWIVGFAGMATLLLGACFAIFQQDIKGLLAYSTISHLGLITLLLSLGSPLGAVAAIFHMMNHATFKASLFMAAGIIDHEAGTRDMRRIGGLFSLMPITGTLAMVASAAMAGVPLLNGFLSKEMFFAETIEQHADSILDTAAPYVAVLASAFAVTYSIRFIHGVFFGPRPADMPHEPHEPPFFMRLPVLLLVIACLLVGTIPGLTIGPYLHSAVVSVLGEATPRYSLAIWHGFTVPLMMSLVALAAGTLLYLNLRSYLATSEEGPPYIRQLKGQRIFERVMVSVAWRWARQLESWLGTRRLQPQLWLLVAVAFAAAVAATVGRPFRPAALTMSGADPVFVGLWAVGIACAVGAAYQAKFHRLVAVILMSGAGLVTCITFVWLSAPDLALTQLVVEVVTTVLILLGLRWLPKRIEGGSDTSTAAAARRYRDLVLALACGAGMTAIAYLVMTSPPPPTIADYFLENAYTGGGGRNVVNVILVDFRGFDTFGEITVLGIVALTVFALLRRFRPAPDTIESPAQQRQQAAVDDPEARPGAGSIASDYLLVPSVIMRWLFPVIAVFAAYLFLRGHDVPGGGFVAGIAMASAFILQYMAAGTRWVEERLRILPVRWMGFGLLTAAATGMGSWLFGYPFLTSHARYLDLALIGKVPAATALVFDLGVFSLVMGATVLMLIALAHQSIRKLRAAKIPAPAEAETSRWN